MLLDPSATPLPAATLVHPTRLPSVHFPGHPLLPTTGPCSSELHNSSWGVRKRGSRSTVCRFRGPRQPSCAARGEPAGQAPVSRPHGVSGLGVTILLPAGTLQRRRASRSCAHGTPSPVPDPEPSHRHTTCCPLPLMSILGGWYAARL